MVHSIDKVTLLPWQTTVLTWAGRVTLVLLLVLIVMTMFVSTKKDVGKRIQTIGRFIFSVFMISAVLSCATAISFLVDVKLRWKLSLLAGPSMILSLVSMVAMSIGGFICKSMKTVYLWAFLFGLSSVSAVYLVANSLGII